MTPDEATAANPTATEAKPIPKGAGEPLGASPTGLIGGNFLSPFYSTAVFVPFGSSQNFVPLTSISGTNWSLPFCRAVPRRKRGLADVTHSWYPISRGLRQTQWTFDCLIHQLTDPGTPAEYNFNASNSVNGFQMYLTLGAVANYPAFDTNQLYFWVPSVFLEEAPHTIDLTKDPVDPIRNDLIIRANGPAFFLPTDNVGSPSPIATFLSWITTCGWGF